MDPRPLHDGEKRDERLGRLGVLCGAFTVVVFGEERFDVVDGVVAELGLVIGGTGAIFVVREGINRAWKANRDRRAARRAANGHEQPRRSG